MGMSKPIGMWACVWLLMQPLAGHAGNVGSCAVIPSNALRLQCYDREAAREESQVPDLETPSNASVATSRPAP